MLLSLPVSLLSRGRHKRLIARMETETRIVALMTFNPQGLSAVEIGEKLNIFFPSLYPSLARLEEDKVITSNWVEGPYPRMRIYRAAVKGEE